MAPGVQIDGNEINPVRAINNTIRGALAFGSGVAASAGFETVSDTLAGAAGSTSVVLPKMDSYVYQHYERRLNGYKYVNELYPEWGWMSKWIFTELDGLRPQMNGSKGFGDLPGQVTR